MPDDDLDLNAEPGHILEGTGCPCRPRILKTKPWQDAEPYIIHHRPLHPGHAALEDARDMETDTERHASICRCNRCDVR